MTYEYLVTSVIVASCASAVSGIMFGVAAGYIIGRNSK